MADYDEMQQFDGGFGEQMGNPDLPYHVDVVICIDATSSMNKDSILEKAKQKAKEFYPMFQERMESYDKRIDQLRIKVIAFRDYAYDGDGAMEESRFYMLPAENDDFESFLQGVSGKGGGDNPENSLEAICLAMRSEWDHEEGVKNRHVILLFTDDDAVPLEDDALPRNGKCKRKDNPLYPTGIPADWSTFTDWWTHPDTDDQGSPLDPPLPGMPSQRFKRMILFAPNANTWNKIASGFNLVWHVVSKAGGGCEEFDIEQALEVVAKSV
jgi:hypothetical protein